MATEFDSLKLQAGELRKQKQFEQASPIYEDLWTNHRTECSEWEGWGYAFCLRKLHRTKEALPVCQEVYKTKLDFTYNNGEYAWCLYELEIKKEDEQIGANEGAFFKAAALVIKLVPQDKFTARAKTVLAVAEYLKGKNNSPVNDMLVWLKNLDPKTLSTDSFSFTDADGKQRELASDQERWYAAMTYALVHIRQWQECVTSCDEALATIRLFHYDNSVWIRRRRALSMWHLDRKEEALGELEDLLKTRKEWFIQFEIAKMLLDLGKNDNALKYAVDAALNAGENDKKLDLFVLLGDIYQSRGKSDEAQQHFGFSYMLRQEQGWRIPPELQQRLTDMGVQVDQLPAAQDLFKILRRRWEEVKKSGQERFTGSISKLNIDAGFGFIDAGNGNSHYFKLNQFRAPRGKLREGLSVTFALELAFDKKKNREVMNAIDIALA